MSFVEWSIKDLVETAKKRIANKFDCNIAVSGERGNSKSTLMFKFFSRFEGFNAWKHQVYSRKEVIKLITTQINGFVFDDEGIASGYKRDFHDKELQGLIKILNMYRDNFNVYGVAIPNFYSLDKDLRDLFKIHINMVGRGIGVVHMAKSDRLYADDKWDIAYNKKVEESWAKMKKYNPDFRPPYDKLTTFVGYIYFNDMTIQQRTLYEEIKKTKRNALYNYDEQDEEAKSRNKWDEIYKRYKKGEIDMKWIENYCSLEGLKLLNVKANLGARARNEGTTLTKIDKQLQDIKLINKANSGGLKVSELA